VGAWWRQRVGGDRWRHVKYVKYATLGIFDVFEGEGVDWNGVQLGWESVCGFSSIGNKQIKK